MEPFRAFVTDKLPDSQVNRGFIMQSLMIGLGGSIASALPWLMNNVFNFENVSQLGQIPENVKASFYIGAFFFLAAVLYTVFTTKEYPPSDAALKDLEKEDKKGFMGGFHEIWHALTHMPKRMQIISLVQFL
jgi:maltose/moltooligosaccharide transporter